MNLIDLLTLISFLALNFDIFLEIGRVHRTQSSQDLSLIGMSARLLASVIILVKFATINSPALLIGQGLFSVTFTIYFVMALVYARRRRA